MSKGKFPKESIIRPTGETCQCNAPHSVRLIAKHEVRFCSLCLTPKAIKELSKKEYEQALIAKFL